MTTKRKTKTKEETLTPAQKIRRILGNNAKAKALYRQVDQLLDELVKEIGVDKPVDCGTAGIFRVADQFASRPFASRTVYVSRYKVEEV